jgi:hypothetical protein
MGGFCVTKGKKKAGAESRTRTDDLLITNQLLYQLSYFGLLFDCIFRPGEGKASPDRGTGKVSIDADSKLMVSYMVGQRGADWANLFMKDVCRCGGARV